jgi:hypothetical protein
MSCISCHGGAKAASLVSSLRLGPRVQRNVFALGGAMWRFKRAETCDGVSCIMRVNFSVRRRLRRGCQTHLS